MSDAFRSGDLRIDRGGLRETNKGRGRPLTDCAAAAHGSGGIGRPLHGGYALIHLSRDRAAGATRHGESLSAAVADSMTEIAILKTADVEDYPKCQTGRIKRRSISSIEWGSVSIII